MKKNFMNARKCEHFDLKTNFYFPKIGNVLKDNCFPKKDGHEVQVEKKIIQVVHTHTKFKPFITIAYMMSFQKCQLILF
jgi:hypothetical protein